MHPAKPRSRSRAPRPLSGAPQGFAYERLAGDVAELIRTGTLRPGDRLPSVRRMCASRGVSMPTVLQAYRLLEARRLVGARPQSGFYVLPPQARPALTRHEPVVAVAEPGAVTTGDLITRVLELVANPALVPLGTALPAEELLPIGALARALRAATRQKPGSARAIVTPSGSDALRREIAKRARSRRWKCSDFVHSRYRWIRRPGPVSKRSLTPSIERRSRRSS